MATKYVTIPIGAVGAGVQSARTEVSTPDDSVARRVTGVKASVTTKGMQVVLDANTAVQATIDAAILGQLTSFAEVDYQVGQNIKLSSQLNNTTGGALATGDFVTLRYSV